MNDKITNELRDALDAIMARVRVSDETLAQGFGAQIDIPAHEIIAARRALEGAE